MIYLQCFSRRPVIRRSSKIDLKYYYFDSTELVWFNNKVQNVSAPISRSTSLGMLNSQSAKFMFVGMFQLLKPWELLSGRRIVDIGYLLQQYHTILQHSQKCTMGRMDFKREVRSGISSKLYFQCNTCDKKEFIVTNSPLTTNKRSLNEIAVWGSMSIGIGHSQCEELFAVLDIPFMAPKTFAKCTLSVKKVGNYYTINEIKKNGQVEKQLAIENGNVNADGTPYIHVICDGGWAKRSYGHGYSSSSGVAVIIGAETKKILFVGVRNKICSTCSYAKRNNVIVKKHVCALNFNGPSTSMEQDIIVDGFCESLSQHGIMYKYLIGEWRCML
ncbi:hypothetical protein RI129_000767 [Pyrocoelia pectoralis]|uniref:Mutator-like transposase domain-containing protein n=1 Tax=Pyrocoelia pectoralis TaxID=417401 RepID=A0AAN7VUY7_9COLE